MTAPTPELCPGDGLPCVLGEGEDTHWRCGTVQCGRPENSTHRTRTDTTAERARAERLTVELGIANRPATHEYDLKIITAALRAAEAGAIERAAQIALAYRDEADNGQHPDANDPHHSLGQGFAANVIAKRIRALASSPAAASAPPAREWLVIEDSRKNAVFAPDEAQAPKGYIPRDVAEVLLGRKLGGMVWFTREDSEKMRTHPEWRDSLPESAEPPDRP